jgi:protein-S-isoprenylcysteine O-methyltransferase Ste14
MIKPDLRRHEFLLPHQKSMRWIGIDLSAWISGLSLNAGLVLAGPASIKAALQHGSQVLWLLPLAYGLCVASVMLIQCHMRLSPLATVFSTPKKLVTGGIFRYSRNPIYVSFLLPLASLAILSSSAAIAAIALYVTAMNLTVIRKEERELMQAFGDEFKDYLKKAPRWIM